MTTDDLPLPQEGDDPWGAKLNAALETLNTGKASQDDFLVLRAQVDSLLNGGAGGSDGPIKTITFDSGIEGEVIPEGTAVSPDIPIIKVRGNPKTTAAAVKHGTRGMQVTLGVPGSIQVNPDRALDFDCRVYFRVDTFGTKNEVELISSLSSVLGGKAGSVRLRTGGAIAVYDADQGAASQPSSAEVGQGNWCRLDYRSKYDTVTSHQTIEARLCNISSESTTADATVRATFPADLPDIISVGNGSATDDWAISFETYSQKAGTKVLIPPFDPDVVNWVHQYEADADGDMVVGVEPDVLDMAGSNAYSTNAVKHGLRGWVCSSGALEYPLQTTDILYQSVYYKPTVKGLDPTPIIVFYDGLTALAQVRIRTGLALGIADMQDNVVAGPTSNSATLGQWTRIDWATQWDLSTGLALTVRYFTIDSEGDSYQEVTYTFPDATEPDSFWLGTSGDGWVGHFDTHRSFLNANQWPNAFIPSQPILPDGVQVRAGDATDTTIEITAYANKATDLGMAYWTQPNQGDLVYLAGGAPIDGYRKWSVTGLDPDTWYWRQACDTPAGGSRQLIGNPGRFKTRAPAGAGGLVVRKIAPVCCHKSAPCRNNIFLDIQNWGPDTLQHLGDDQYADQLTKHAISHKTSWANSFLDPALGPPADLMNWDYVISDHDSTGNLNNWPNFNDPITKANIAAWKQMIPARMEDTRAFFTFEDGQTYPAGRFRSEQEGYVLYLKVDTRSLERTDTRNIAGIGPLDTGNSMLGAFQLDWWKAKIDYARANRLLVVMFTDPCWLGISPPGDDVGPIPVTYSDKWGSYVVERDYMSDYAAGIASDVPNSTRVEMFVVYGDSHLIQQDDGGNEKNGYASICSAPADQNMHAHYQFQNIHQKNYPPGVLGGEGKQPEAQMYQRLTIDQVSNPGHAILTAEVRDCSVKTLKKYGQPITPKMRWDATQSTYVIDQTGGDPLMLTKTYAVGP